MKKKMIKSIGQKRFHLLNQIKSGLKDVIDIKAGKVDRLTLSEGLNIIPGPLSSATLKQHK